MICVGCILAGSYSTRHAGISFGSLGVFCSRAIMSGRLELLQTLTGTSRQLLHRILRNNDTCWIATIAWQKGLGQTSTNIRWLSVLLCGSLSWEGEQGNVERRFRGRSNEIYLIVMIKAKCFVVLNTRRNSGVSIIASRFKFFAEVYIYSVC